MSVYNATTVYYRIVVQYITGAYVWDSILYYYPQQLTPALRVRPNPHFFYIFAATSPERLDWMLERWNRGETAVCMRGDYFLHGADFGPGRVVELEQLILKEASQQPYTPTAEEEKRWEWLRWMLGRGRLTEWPIEERRT